MQRITLALAAVIAALALTGTAWGQTPKINCGTIGPGSANPVTWSGDTAQASFNGYATTCGAGRLVYYNWNGTWSTSSTFQASPGQQGSLQIGIGDTDMNYCSYGWDCPVQSNVVAWTDPNGTGGPPPGGGGGTTAPCSFTALTSNSPTSSSNSVILYYTETGCTSITVSPGSTFPSSTDGAHTYNAGVLGAGSYTYQITGKNGAGQQGNTLQTVVTVTDPGTGETADGLPGTTDANASDSGYGINTYNFQTGAWTSCRKAQVWMKYTSYLGFQNWEWDVTIPFCAILGPTTSLVAKVTSIGTPYDTVHELPNWSEDTGAFNWTIVNAAGHYTATVLVRTTFTGCALGVGGGGLICLHKQPYMYVNMNASPYVSVGPGGWGNG